jgi:hypothetical protein
MICIYRQDQALSWRFTGLYCFPDALLTLYWRFTDAFLLLYWRFTDALLAFLGAESEGPDNWDGKPSGRWYRYVCLLTLYWRFTDALLMLYWCFTDALLMLYLCCWDGKPSGRQ